jgi:hypothetical protein
MNRFRIRSSYQPTALAPPDLVREIATDDSGVRLGIVWLANLRQQEQADVAQRERAQDDQPTWRPKRSQKPQ